MLVHGGFVDGGGWERLYNSAPGLRQAKHGGADEPALTGVAAKVLGRYTEERVALIKERTESGRSELDTLALAFAPLWLIVGLALRLTKVSPEVRIELEKRRGATRKEVGDDLIQSNVVSSAAVAGETLPSPAESTRVEPPAEASAIVTDSAPARKDPIPPTAPSEKGAALQTGETRDAPESRPGKRDL